MPSPRRNRSAVLPAILSAALLPLLALALPHDHDAVNAVFAASQVPPGTPISGPDGSAAPHRPPITGLAFVRFYESDLPAAKHFYTAELGLPSIAPLPGTSGAVSAFAVGPVQRIEIAPLPAADQGHVTARLAEVGFLTTDLAAMRQFLEANHVAAQSSGPDGIHVLDPEGNHIAFLLDRAAETHRPTPPASGTPGAPASTRMIHAGFLVHSRTAENRFYLDLLGFKPYWFGGMNPDHTDWVSLQVPDGHDWIEYMLEAGSNPSQRTLGVLDHTSLGVEDIHAAARQLAANGMTNANAGGPPKTPAAAVQMGKDGKYQLNVFDPDQSRIEYMEFRPRQTPCCSAPTADPPSPNDPN